MTPEEFDADVRRLTEEMSRELKKLAEGIKLVPPAQQQRFADECFRCLMRVVKQQQLTAHKLTALRTSRKDKGHQTVLVRRMVEVLNLQRKQLKEMLAALLKVNAELAKAKKTQ